VTGKMAKVRVREINLLLWPCLATICNPVAPLLLLLSKTALLSTSTTMHAVGLIILVFKLLVGSKTRSFSRFAHFYLFVK